jgi:predicted DCC family thiol-disulfide oxidoreductase YuxK
LPNKTAAIAPVADGPNNPLSACDVAAGTLSLMPGGIAMAEQRVKLLYDGDCPFCSREVAWLKRRDRHDRLALENIAAIGFDPTPYGLTREEVMASLHVVLPDGRVVQGVEAVRQAGKAVGLGWMVAPTRLPIVRGILDRTYGLFARNRVRLGGLFGRGCNSGTCGAKTPVARKSKTSV